MSEALDLLLFTNMGAVPPAPVVNGALDLFLMMGSDPGGTPPVTPAESIWRPTFRPRRR